MEIFSKQFFNIQITKFIFLCIKPFRWWIYGQVFVALILAIDLSLRPYLLKIMLDCVSIGYVSKTYHTLLSTALGYIFLSLVFILMFRFFDFIWLNINSLLKRHIGLILMKRMLYHSYHFYQNNFAGSLGNKIKDVMSGIPDLLRIIINRFLNYFLSLIIAIGTVGTVNFKFSIFLSIWVTIFILISFNFAKAAQKFCNTAAEMKSIAIGSIIDVLSNVISVRLFTNHKFEQKKLLTELDSCVNADRARDWFFLKRLAIQGGSFIVYQCVCIFWLIQEFKNRNISPGDFALILTVNVAIVDCLGSLAIDIGKFAEILGEIIQGLRLALSPFEIQNIPNAKKLIVEKGEISFNSVCFHYKKTTALFNNKSITILPGQKIGLVGYSGSGKTTFVNLILRLFDITSGKILIDGYDISTVTQSSLRSNIGMIPQDTYLFHKSIMENIRYGLISATDKQVIEASKKAYVHDFVSKLDYGYNSLVGERGIKLSGGQRQRIAIARVILKNAPILILDEATSQLDSITEQNIQESLCELMQNKTTLVIAHRLSTILKMDRILVFDKGRIVEDGTHKELIFKGGLYKTLWATQTGGFLPEKMELNYEHSFQSS